MTSPLTTARANIKTIWEALTPPDLTAQVYREAARAPEAEALAQGPSDHRTFWWVVPASCDISGEHGGDYSECAWAFEAKMYLSSVGRSNAQDFDAAANEIALLRRAIDKHSSWGAGVMGVKLERVSSEPFKDGVILTFAIDAMTSEED
jgi:hypothetical protein